MLADDRMPLVDWNEALSVVPSANQSTQLGQLVKIFLGEPVARSALNRFPQTKFEVDQPPRAPHVFRNAAHSQCKVSDEISMSRVILADRFNRGIVHAVSKPRRSRLASETLIRSLARPALFEAMFRAGDDPFIHSRVGKARRPRARALRPLLSKLPFECQPRSLGQRFRQAERPFLGIVFGSHGLGHVRENDTSRAPLPQTRGAIPPSAASRQSPSPRARRSAARPRASASRRRRR